VDFQRRMGIPEMESFWNDLCLKSQKGIMKGPEKALFKKLIKSFKFLQQNPKYSGLQTHEISSLSKKIWYESMAVIS